VESSSPQRVGVLVVAYNAASTLAAVLDRLPLTFRERVDHVLVCDDASSDATHLVALGYQTLTDLPLTVIRHEKNLGYGGNQKAGYRWAIEQGLDIVVLLHGDGQYKPEVIESLVEPLETGECDAVFGSRMMTKRGALQGGMPKYKYVGNKILTRAENWLAGMSLSEWHSGYRAYRIDALREVPFESFSDGFDFDTQIILGLHEYGKTIHEVPIPTYYGDEISHVNGIKYAKDIIMHATRYRLRSMGFGGGIASVDPHYELKIDPHSSHACLVDWFEKKPPGAVLDLGCSSGVLASAIRCHGHRVTGVDIAKIDGAASNLDEFVEADLNAGVPEVITGQFEVVLAADVLEHLMSPHHLLDSIHRCLSPTGSVFVSIPNFGHWYPRLRVLTGTFDYDRRGILDAGHLRFFTRRSFVALARRSGFRVKRQVAVGLPRDALDLSMRSPLPGFRAAGTVDRVASKIWPGLFAYQYVFDLGPSPDRLATTVS
jgi:glycosyltransferase involved in cell wall biosynthesis